MMMCEAMERHAVSDKMELHFLERSTLSDIEQRLENEEDHILCFTGHGIYSQREQMCYLLFEDAFGNARRVDSETIADILAGHGSLRLVVLTGCHSVLAVGHRVLGELPVSLLFKNVPAVIVMQYSVTDESAITLSDQLFAGICEGVPLDVALTNVRAELLRAGNEGAVDFGSPILYTNDPDCLFHKNRSRRPGRMKRERT